MCISNSLFYIVHNYVHVILKKACFSQKIKNTSNKYTKNVESGLFAKSEKTEGRSPKLSTTARFELARRFAIGFRDQLLNQFRRDRNNRTSSSDKLPNLQGRKPRQYINNMEISLINIHRQEYSTNYIHTSIFFSQS